MITFFRNCGWIKVSLALVMLCVVCVAAALWWAQRWLNGELNVPEQGYVYELRSGGSLSLLAHDLARAGILKHPRMLSAYARLTSNTNIKVGEYRIKPGETPMSLLQRLVRGDVITYQVTFVEGWTFRQALIHLQGSQKINVLLATDELLNQFLEDLEIENGNPEGWFFPDTYQYVAATSDKEILQRAYIKMKDVLATEWANRADNLPYENPYQALIMASIVERETGVVSERQQIAGVFVRRLQRNMRLQTDPTVIYGMGESYTGNIRRSDLRRPTPYNTYVIRGLPPTPIALPGREAIHAALHPEPGEALFFVARGDGSHQFSATLEEHNRAVRQYQIEQRAQDYQSAPTRESQ